MLIDFNKNSTHEFFFKSVL